MRRYSRVVVVVAVVAVGAAAMYPLFASVTWEGAAMAWLAPLGLFLVGGYWWGRWRALLWLAVVPWFVVSLLADVAWGVGLWDRSSEYEPLPLTMFVVVFGM